MNSIHNSNHQSISRQYAEPRARRSSMPRARRGATCIVALVLVLTMALGASCGVSGKGRSTGTQSHSVGSALPSSAPISPLSQWLPDKTFSSLIWGAYSVVGKKISSIEPDDLKDFLNGMKFEQLATNISAEDNVSILPVNILSGARSNEYAFTPSLRKLGYELIEYCIYSEEYQGLRWMDKPYKVEGNKIIIFWEWEFEYTYPDLVHKGNNDATFSINTDKTIEIEFWFEGRDLILSREGVQARMLPLSRPYGEVDDDFLIGQHLNNDSPAFIEIMYLQTYIASNNNDTPAANVYFGHDKASSATEIAVDPVVELYSNGLMHISWSERSVNNRRDKEPDPTDFWCHYIWCGGRGGDGIILIDEDGNIYQYQTDDRGFASEVLVDSLDVPLEDLNLSDSRVEELVQTHGSILDSLQESFADADVAADIDLDTGRITMDSSILFAVGDYTLSDEGKAYLDEFLDAYSSVVLSDAHAGNISQIIVEGHTDSDGTYDQNMVLSENRALAVAEYCLSRHPALAEIMVTKGYAYDQLVYDENGVEDKAASRRVVFKFILNVND